MKAAVCYFSGPRYLPEDKIEGIIKRLNDEIENLYRQGVVDYVSSGAPGFDQIAASLIIAKRKMGHKVPLILALPYKNKDEHWTVAQRQLYQLLLYEADEIVYLSEATTPDCIWKRNAYMVEQSSYCICALLNDKSNTERTICYARKNNVKIINVAE